MMRNSDPYGWTSLCLALRPMYMTEDFISVDDQILPQEWEMNMLRRIDTYLEYLCSYYAPLQELKQLLNPTVMNKESRLHRCIRLMNFYVESLHDNSQPAPLCNPCRITRHGCG